MGLSFNADLRLIKQKKTQTQKKYIYWKPFSVFFVDIDPTKSGCVPSLIHDYFQNDCVYVYIYICVWLHDKT